MSFEEISEGLQGKEDSTDYSRPSTNTDPEIVAGIPPGEQASSVHSDDEVPSTRREEGTSTEDSPRVLSDPVLSRQSATSQSGFKHLSLTLPNLEALGITWEKIKFKVTFDIIAQGLLSFGRWKKPQVKNGVVVKDTMNGVVVLRIALEIKGE